MNAAAPPRRVFWLGAGISIAQPTALPAAEPLVAHWLRYLLPVEDSGWLLALYGRHERLLGKRIPRLEKLVEDAVSVFGEPVLHLLQLFQDVAPNTNHLAVADYLTRHRGWAVTTNFDTAIEAAAPSGIPVHTPEQDGREPWGLIKLHGSIDESLPRLGHSIHNLVHGLTPRLANHIGEMLDQLEVECVFAGYSGSDYFDVVPYFLRRNERPFAARAVWLDHAAGAPVEVSADGLPDGALTMLKAFSGARVLRGDTAFALAEMTGMTAVGGGVGRDWRMSWETHFLPEDWQRHLYAAKLYASLGIGRRSLEAALQARDGGAPDSLRLRQFIANGLRDCGCYATEIAFRRQASAMVTTAVERVFWMRQWAAALRLGKRRLAAWRAYGGLVREVLRSPMGDSELVDEQVLSLAEAALFYRDGLIRLPQNRLFHSLASFFKGRIRRLLDEPKFLC